MTIHLPEDLGAAIRAEVSSGRHASADAMVAEIVREHLHLVTSPTDGAVEGAPVRKPLWQRAAELSQTIPAEKWAKLPVDGSAQIDHYLYGSPKRFDS